MFSKALFKQSCKANGIMWTIITVAVCFMLSCVMLISGSGDIATIKNGIEDTIIESAIDAQISKQALNYYELDSASLAAFDQYFVEEISKFDTGNNEEYNAIYSNAYQNAMLAGKSTEEAQAIAEQSVLMAVYTNAMNKSTAFIIEKSGAETTDAIEEVTALLKVSLNPSNAADSFYTAVGETPISYNLQTPSILDAEKRADYISEYSSKAITIFLAANMSDERAVQQILEVLKDYGVTESKYNSYGYTYSKIKEDSGATVVEYLARYKYEINNLDSSAENYEELVNNTKNELIKEFSGNFLTSLPSEVSDALREVGSMDLYELIVGSIFYKMAGLLLPIIYVIMVSNSLIAGQVDSGSMAYILSTSTKRSKVCFTQAIYLILSIFVMTVCTTVTSVICLSKVKTADITLSYSNLLYMNLGFFCVLIAISGLCFLTSAWFNRSKRAMAIGGGLSMFFLVATMLGLFGSSALPSVVRLTALNAFNYVSIISLFDVMSILQGTFTFVWKFVILVVAGLICYIVGSWKFINKDLPL